MTAHPTVWAIDRRGGRRVKKMAILFAVVGLMVVLFAGTALAVVRVGNNGPNRLVGTAENDTLRGRGGAHHRQEGL
jgi:hypothetical protein